MLAIAGNLASGCCGILNFRHLRYLSAVYDDDAYHYSTKLHKKQEFIVVYTPPLKVSKNTLSPERVFLGKVCRLLFFGNFFDLFYLFGLDNRTGAYRNLATNDHVFL